MRKLAPFVLPLLFAACAAPGPVVPVAPRVQVAHFNSHLITPEAIRFTAKVVIKNKMRGPLKIERVEWGANLHDSPMVDGTFQKCHPMRARGKQTVTIPFEVAMSRIVEQAVDVLAEESVRVTFRGFVCPVGFERIPFQATKVLPLPKIPVVSMEGFEGNPLGGSFTVFLGIANSNEFPLSVSTVETHLTLNRKQYDLLRTERTTDVAPGARCRIALTMRQTRGKSLSMAWNVLHSQSANFEIGGLIRCKTPHGVIHLPVALLSEESETPTRDREDLAD